MEPAPAELDAADLARLAEAKRLLEQPGLAARLTALVGSPIEAALERLPPGWESRVQAVVRRSLEGALEIAVRTLDDPAAPRPAGEKAHRWMAGASGAVGGALGLSALAVELPVSTGIMLRSVAAVARSEGEDLRAPETQLQCLSVFALGGASGRDDAAETGYFAVRAALGRLVSEAAAQLASRGAGGTGGGAVAGLLARIASRYFPQVGQKLAAQAVPVLGAAGGATVNVLFTRHFQDVARGHFTVRRLERRYGAAAVAAAYQRLPAP